MTEKQVKLINHEIRLCKACDRPLKGVLKLTKTGKIATIPPICEACRKFYCRYLNATESWVCTCGGAVRSTNNNDDDKDICRRCRFQRCQIALKQSAEERRSAAAGHHHIVQTSAPVAFSISSPAAVKQQTTSQNDHPGVQRAGNGNRGHNSHQSNESGSSANQPKSRLDFSKIPCKICGCSSAGIHFGVVSCEGCKSFFGRWRRGTLCMQYRCKRAKKGAPLDEEPVKLCSPSSNCRKCRLRRCIAAGMSQSEWAIGRLNRHVRKELAETIERLAKQQSDLNEPISRRHNKKQVSLSLSKDNKANTSQEKPTSSSQSEADSNSQMVENYNRTLSSSTSSGNSSSEEEEEDEDLRNDAWSGSGEKSVSISFDESGANNCLLSLQPTQLSTSVNSSEDSSANHYHDAEMMEVRPMPNCPFFGSQLARYEEGVDPLADLVDMPTVVGEGLSSLSGYNKIPRDVPVPNEFNSAELSLVPVPILHSVISNSEIEASRWFIDRSVEAAARLAPISSVQIIADPKTTTKHEMLAERSRAFDIYIKSISDFLVNLPEMSGFSIQDRISLFANGFFPLLIAQVSLIQFDVVRQMLLDQLICCPLPNNLSLDRDSCTWEMVGHCNSWQHLIENYLSDASNIFKNTAFNLQEYALLCAMLCFNGEVPFVCDRDKLNVIQGRYHMAYMRYLQETGGVSQERIDRFQQLLQFFRRSTSVFQCEIRALPIHCKCYLENSSSLFKDFRLQFMTLTQPPLGPCAKIDH